MVKSDACEESSDVLGTDCGVKDVRSEVLQSSIGYIDDLYRQAVVGTNSPALLQRSKHVQT